MPNILEEIVAEKRLEIARLRPQLDKLRQAAAARTDFRDFAGTIRGGFISSQTAIQHSAVGAAPSKQIALIAEVKKASPSAGVIARNFDAVRIARKYEAAGASALSVLTDEKFFQGRLEYLQQIRAVTKLPLLRKDFIIDELQVYQSVAVGADAILLIVAILDDKQLKGFRELAEEMHLVALVEVHDERELDRAAASGATMIGINNRDLRDFSVSLATTERLCRGIRGSDSGEDAGPTKNRGPIVVAESGFNTRADVERVVKAGVNALLVGESLMRSGDIAAKVKELMG